MQIKSLGCLCTPHERSLLQLDARDCCQDLSGHVRICQEYQLSKISQGFIPCSHTKQNMAWTSVSASNVTSLLDQFISTWKLLVKIIYSQVALTCCLVGWYLKPISYYHMSQNVLLNCCRGYVVSLVPSIEILLH